MTTPFLSSRPRAIAPATGPLRRHARSGLAALLLLPAAVAAAPSGGEVEWFYGSFDAAQAKASERGQSILVYFWNDGSAQSGRFYTESLESDAAARMLGDYVCVSAKLNDPAGAELFKRFNVRSMPTILVLDSNGDVEDGIIGYIERDGFVAEMKRIGDGKGTVSVMRREAAEAPDNLEVQYQLALKLQDLGNTSGHDEILAAIRERDPEGKTETGAGIAWRATVKEIFASTNDPKEVDLKPVYAFLAACEQDRTLFAGWDWLSRIEYAQGNREGMRKAVRNAWKHVPDERVMDWGTEIGQKAWGLREELSKDDRKLALKIATKALASVEAFAAEQAEDSEPSTKMRRFMARSLSGLACCQQMNGKRKAALASLRRSIEMDPENEAYPKLLAEFEAANS
ncbi:MAG: hypothetical protein AAF628_27850 [Planctomycetota bacterium]